MVTKRGTNQFHGTGYYYYNSSDVGGANTWDNNHTPSGNLGYTPIPITHNNRYGGTVGGPMLPKFWGGKTYFFFGYEGFNYPAIADYQQAGAHRHASRAASFRSTKAAHTFPSISIPSR